MEIWGRYLSLDRADGGGEEDLHVFGVELVKANPNPKPSLSLSLTLSLTRYAAGSEASKLAFVESWVRSEHIDIFSPQLYSRLGLAS